MLLALALMQAAAPAAATGGPPTVVTAPDWLKRPTAADAARVFPPAAKKAFQAGTVTLQCGVNAEGLLVDCTVTSETPQGFGFGDAALRMGHRFKMRPSTRGGVAVAGGTVRIPLRFLPPAELRAPVLRATAPAHAGIAVELNCRFRGRQLDNCLVANSPLPPPEAIATAVGLVEEVTLPPMPRAAGRIAIPLQFER